MVILKNLPLIFFSFTASVGFGVVFGIKPRALPMAGLGGVLTRVVLLLAMECTGSRFWYILIASLAGAFYSECIARKKHTPLAKYLYPALVPVIPGDMLYNTVVCFVKTDPGFFDYGSELLLALLGMAIGSMLAPMLAHSPTYFREVAACVRKK